MIKNSTIELCKKALSIDSSIVNGTSEYTEFISNLATSIGLHVQTKSYLFRDLDFQNILITQGKDTSKIKYLFVNPIDTEAPGPFRSWTETDQDPFDITIKDGKMFGLGANSGKLNTILLLKSLTELSNEKREKFAILGTYGREVRAHGALRFLKEKKIAPMSTIVGFPTANEIVYAQAGRMRMRINFPFTDSEKELRTQHDEQEHSSSESQYFHSKDEIAKGQLFGRHNAIVDALQFIENLPDSLLVLDLAGGKDLYSDPRSCLFEFDLVGNHDVSMGSKLKGFSSYMLELNKSFAEKSNKDYLPVHPMIHLGRVVCDLEGIEFWGECVFPPGIPEDVSELWIKGLRDEIKQLGGSSKMLSQRWPYVYDGDFDFLNQLLEINESEKPKPLAYTSEADLFSLAGFNPLIFGAGSFDQMFKPNEYIHINSLDDALSFYQKVLNQLV